MEEIWRDIEGYEGLYQVSNLGNVKSLPRERGNQYSNKEIILKQKIGKYGYCSVSLKKDGKLKFHLIHRLVAQAFIPNPNNYPVVNHKDENKQNNCVENLEWCTMAYNNAYGTHIKTYDRPMLKKNRPDKSKPVIQYDFDMNAIAVYPSISEAERQTGIGNTHISSCCRNEYGCKTAGGFKWRYAE